jgi:cobalt-zinc-cadmium efflux system membrane fusion protein
MRKRRLLTVRANASRTSRPTLMTRRVLLATALGCAFLVTMRAQAPATAPQPSAVTRTVYSKNTELFAEWRPMIVGQAIRLTAHLTRIADRFRPYAEGKVTLTLTITGVTATAAADGPERPGVFRLNVTPTKAGTGRVVIDVAASTGSDHFVMVDVPVYSDVQAAIATQPPLEPGFISYAKERSWEEDFATAPGWPSTFPALRASSPCRQRRSYAMERPLTCTFNGLPNASNSGR